MIGFACSNSPIDDEWNHIRRFDVSFNISRSILLYNPLRPSNPRRILVLKNARNLQYRPKERYKYNIIGNKPDFFHQTVNE